MTIGKIEAHRKTGRASVRQIELIMEAMALQYLSKAFNDRTFEDHSFIVMKFHVPGGDRGNP